MAKYINASQAHKMFVKAGLDMSYPTALKHVRKIKGNKQLTGQFGQVIVPEKNVIAYIEELKDEKREDTCSRCS